MRMQRRTMWAESRIRGDKIAKEGFFCYKNVLNALRFFHEASPARSLDLSA